MNKKCCMCHNEKSISEFASCVRNKDGLQTQCRECALEYSRRPEVKERRKELAAKKWSNGVTRDARYQKLFGITIEDYYRMYFEQKEVCAICLRPPQPRKVRGGSMTANLCVDHCHKTGKVRGLLCNNCNSFIGFAEDNPEWLNKAITYLAAFET